MSLAEWASLEYGACVMGHADRNAREAIIAQDIGRAVDRPYGEAACGDQKRITAYNYFMESGQKKTSFDGILSGPVECTWRRGLGAGLMRIHQDGTDISLNGLRMAEGLGDAGSDQTGGRFRGLHLHAGLAVDGQNRCLGIAGAVLLDPERTAPEDMISAEQTNLEERMRQIWIRMARRCEEYAAYMPDTLVVAVGERECDFSGYHYAVSQLAHVKSVVRACRDRNLSDDPRTLFTFVSDQEIAGTVKIGIARQSALSGSTAEKERDAVRALMNVRFCTVRIAPPPEMNDADPLALHCVAAVEDGSAKPGDGERIAWILLTTCSVNSFEDAVAVVEHYASRWKLKKWHRVLKHGCQVEALSCGSRESLDRMLAFRVSEASRIMRALDLGCPDGDASLEAVFPEVEMMVLSALAKKDGPEN